MGSLKKNQHFRVTLFWEDLLFCQKVFFFRSALECYFLITIKDSEGGKEKCSLFTGRLCQKWHLAKQLLRGGVLS